MRGLSFIHRGTAPVVQSVPPCAPRSLRDYRTAQEIRDRLDVLYAKAARITAYDASVVEGFPDVALLDEKQQAIIRERGTGPQGLFPPRVFRTLRRTIDALETRQHYLPRAERAA